MGDVHRHYTHSLSDYAQANRELFVRDPNSFCRGKVASLVTAFL